MLSHCPKGKLKAFAFDVRIPNLIIIRSHSDRYDFYLVPQSVRQGTVSATNFNVIYDQMELPPDKLQLLTYKLSHLYVNTFQTFSLNNNLSLKQKCLNRFDFLFYFAVQLEWNGSCTGCVQICKQIGISSRTVPASGSE